MFRTDDTIVAISTAAGNAARAIVRLSGPRAIQIASIVFTPVAGELAQAKGFTAHAGLVRFRGTGVPPVSCFLGGTDSERTEEEGIETNENTREGEEEEEEKTTHGRDAHATELPAIAYLFRGPRSFTRQDVVELHIPGAAVAASSLCAALIEAGARQAEGGEFTARAFFSGRIDLSQAQAVADIINAADAASLRCAVGNLGGNVYRICHGTASAVADALATVEASIDLADEQIQLDSPTAMAKRLAELSARAGAAARQAALVGDIADVPQVAIAGRPNAGKSSLVNALCGADRSIVSRLPGTTRDVLSAPLDLGPNQRVSLLDVAGLTSSTRIPPLSGANTMRSTGILPVSRTGVPPVASSSVSSSSSSSSSAAAAHAVSFDSISSAADRAARNAIARADAIVFVIDAAGAPHDVLEHDLTLLGAIRASNRHCPVMIAANKSDALSAAAIAATTAHLTQRTSLPVVATSCITGDGLPELKTRLADCLRTQAWRDGSTLALHQSQKRCLLLAGDAISRAVALLGDAGEIADVAELVAIELREALWQLGEISGQVVNEDILGRIFQRFCVGK
jgi:tRNA modification GTPase